MATGSIAGGSGTHFLYLQWRATKVSFSIASEHRTSDVNAILPVITSPNNSPRMKEGPFIPSAKEGHVRLLQSFLVKLLVPGFDIWEQK